MASEFLKVVGLSAFHPCMYFKIVWRSYLVGLVGVYKLLISLTAMNCFVSTKPFFLTYVKRETDVRKINWLSGPGPFANRPADPPARQKFDSGRQHPSEKTDGGHIGSVDTGL